jgi:isocitrate dehydrogenase
MQARVALAPGDGIGPEITEAVLSIFEAAKVPVLFERIEMGLQVYNRGVSSGIAPEAMATIEKLGVLFKGPMETPKGKGVKSINVTARKVWNTYANKRVFRSLHGVDTPFSRAGIPIQLTLVRENIEDTYGGIEHFLTHDVALCRRFITRPGSEQVHRYTFEMARKNGLKKVTCGHKANIMKLTDGLFLEVFYEVAKGYPEIVANDVIVDDLAMKLVRRPDQFEVIVLPNLQGDIISDLCAGLVGGLGFAPSANIGDSVAIFEAVHGTAPDIAGKGIGNPTSLLMSGLMMLRHLGLHGKAALIENALLATLESGVRTADFGSHEVTASSTSEFAAAIISRLGTEPKHNPVRGDDMETPFNHPTAELAVKRQHRIIESPKAEGKIVGMDLFVEINQQPGAVAAIIESLLEAPYTLTLISNRGTQVWPSGSVLTDCVNQYRVRIEAPKESSPTDVDMLKLAVQLAQHMKVCSTELLMNYNGVPAYSLAQGQ